MARAKALNVHDPCQRVALGYLDRMVCTGVVNQNNFKVLVVLLEDHGKAMAYPALFVFGADDNRDCRHWLSHSY
jgi:hypothetical protein